MKSPKPKLVLVTKFSDEHPLKKNIITKIKTKTIGKNKIIEDIVCQLSNNYTTIISREQLKEHSELDWGDNGIGDRWANKKFNYTVIYHSKKVKTYSENDNDVLDSVIVTDFLAQHSLAKGIVGIFVHSKRTNISNRPIRKDIDKEIKKYSCVSCGSNSDIICDHKNDIYNDKEVLHIKTQKLEDFQPLCNHCNLQKRQIFKDETRESKIYSAKNFQKYKMYPFEFPWEKKAFDIHDVNTKKDTYWYDPVEFNNKIYLYMTCILPILYQIKISNKNIK